MNMQLPPGWTLHPQYPTTHAVQVSNPNNIQPLSAFQAQAPQPAAPPVAAPPAAAPQYAAPPAAPVQQQYAPPPNEFSDAPALGLDQYQAQDTKQLMQHHEKQERATRGWEEKNDIAVWDKFGPTKNVHDEATIQARFIPNLHSPKDMCIPVRRHRIFVEYVPNATEGQVRYIPCYNQPGAPQDCPICEALDLVKASMNEAAVKHCKNMSPRVNFIWQFIRLDDYSIHWTKDAEGNTKILPAVIGIPKKLNNELQAIVRRNSDITHPHTGTDVLLRKRKDGTDNMEVSYSATAIQQGPIPESLRCVAMASVDLHKHFVVDACYRPETMFGIRDAILKRWDIAVPGAAAEWLPHPNAPGFEYNAAGMMRPVQAAAPPPPPPAPAFPSYQGHAAPPALPPAAPPAMPPMAQMPQQPPAQPPAYQPPPVQMGPPPVAAPAAPPMQHAPPPMPPAQPPVMQHQPPQQMPVGPPQAPPAGLPPAIAPGLPPAAVPGLPPQAAAPPALPGPGMPPMPAAAPPAPPAPAAPPPMPTPPGGGMTPAQLEASMGLPTLPGVPLAAPGPAPLPPAPSEVPF